MAPNIFTIGGLTLSWHGLFTVLAIGVAIGITLYRARGSGFSEDFLYTAAIWGVVGGMVGARLVHVIANLSYYVQHLGQVVAVWAGGASILGAILGATVGVWVYTALKGESFWRLTDLAALAGPLAQATGRVGCVINGDAYGTPTSLPWGFVYTHPSAFAELGVAGHPAPVYEIIWDLIVFTVLWRWRWRLRPQGSLFLLYLSLYSLGRFFISFVRVEPAWLGSLHQAHIISLLVLAVAVPLLLTRSLGGGAVSPAAEEIAQHSQE
jgi:phosphatidylglycerol:prolipoprotein diacylglycerol transferase